MHLGGGCSKLGLDRTYWFGLGLSGVTPGKREGLAFRGVSGHCALRRMAHAELDSLEYAAAIGRAGQGIPRR